MSRRSGCQSWARSRVGHIFTSFGFKLPADFDQIVLCGHEDMDVHNCGSHNLAGVDCIAAGFPCTDISLAGSRRKGGQQGLNGSSSGLFFEVVRILSEVQPTWLVLENVAALLSSNDCRDIEVVIRSLAERGYVGFWRVLNSQYFGIPQRCRRIFLVAGLGRYPSTEFLADAAPVEAVPGTLSALAKPRHADALAGYTLTAKNAASRINLGCEVLVAEEDGWDSMVERGPRIFATRAFPRIG